CQQHTEPSLVKTILSKRSFKQYQPLAIIFNKPYAECIRFFACNQIRDELDSRTSLATSSPRCAGKQCIKIASDFALAKTFSSIVKPSNDFLIWSASASSPIETHTSV